jgi:hypothetical protein
MHTLYDSDAFLVNHLFATHDDAAPSTDRPDAPVLLRHGFEIVDKRSGKEVYLDGSWAEFFQQRLTQWQQTMPSQEEVEDTLAQYAELAQTPVCVH